MSDISFPIITDTIPFWAVGLFGTVGPILLIILIELGNARLLPFQNRNELSYGLLFRKFGIFLFHGLSLFILGISIVLLLTEIGKRWIGEYANNKKIRVWV